MPYQLTSGTVQPYVVSRDITPMFMHFFGRAEYDSRKPVISESIREQAQPIVDGLNRDELTEAEARKLLDCIRW